LAFKRFGAANFQEISTLSSAYIIVNYFDLGFIGMVRRIASEPTYTLGQKLWHTLDLGLRSLRWVVATEVLLGLVGLAVSTTGITCLRALDHPGSLFLALAMSPAFLYLSIIRAFLEGHGRILASNMIRGGIGVIVVASPFMAEALFGNWHHFFYFPPAAAVLAILGSLYFTLARRERIEHAIGSSYLNRVGWMEVVYTLAGVFFLYSDRFIFLFIGRTEEIGHYLLAMDIATRTSLLYVPITIYYYPKIVQAYRGGGGGLKYFRRSELGSAAVTSAAYLGLAVLVGIFQNRLPPRLLNPHFIFSFTCIAIGQVFISMNYSAQRFLTLAVARLRMIALGYGMMVLIFIPTLTLGVFRFGVIAAPIAFLLRSIVERFMLKRTIREALSYGDV
jgi:hypothetical protein